MSRQIIKTAMEYNKSLDAGDSAETTRLADRLEVLSDKDLAFLDLYYVHPLFSPYVLAVNFLDKKPNKVKQSVEIMKKPKLSEILRAQTMGGFWDVFKSMFQGSAKL